MSNMPQSWRDENWREMMPQAIMSPHPRIDNANVTLGVGRVPKTKSLTIRFQSNPLYLSLGNAGERKSVRRFAEELIRLCDLHEVKQ